MGMPQSVSVSSLLADVIVDVDVPQARLKKSNSIRGKVTKCSNLGDSCRPDCPDALRSLFQDVQFISVK